MSDAQPPFFRVLVVEDEPVVSMLIESVLDDLGWEMVGPAAALTEALALAASEKIDGAVLDLNIRGGRSYPVAELLLSRGIPVIVASGYGEWTLPDYLRGQGRLEKPYTSDQLRRELCALPTRTIAPAVVAVPESQPPSG